MAMYYYAATLLMVLSLWTPAEPAPLCPGMTTEAYQILVNVMQDLGIKDSDLKGLCVPVYRLDLPAKYVAYHVVFTKKEYFITSAGKQTCDRDLIVQSNSTSPIKTMDKAAKKDNAKCHQYYLLSDAIDMVCKDTSGKTVGSTFDKITLNQILKKFGSLDKYLADRSKALKKTFKARCKTLRAEEQGEKPPEGKSGATVISVESLQPGETKLIVLSSPPEKVTIQYMHEQQHITDEEMAEGLKQVCSDIKDCSVDGKVGLMGDPAILSDPDGVKLVISSEAKENIFALQIHKADGSIEEKYYEIEKPQPVKRGWYQYTSWYPFTYCYIRSYWLYPRYCPYMYNGCFIGSGPLAWAHVFGYYDRYGCCTCLYRNTYNGLGSGSCSLKAPYSRDSRMTYYANYLKSLIGASCSGATYDSAMMRARNHFASQCYNRPIYYKTSNLNTWVYSYVCGGRPAIVRVRTSTSYKYATVLGVRRRYYRRRYCYKFLWWTRCRSWYTYWDYDYYLDWNMCTGRGWYNMGSYWAAVAMC